MDKNYPELRPWGKLVGISGDLADVIVGVLSWASIAHGVAIISLTDFYLRFIQLSKEFPDQIQDLQAVTRRSALGNFLFSTRLCDSLEAALNLGIRIQGDGRSLYMPVETSRANLDRLRKRLGDEFVNELKPLCDRFSELVREGDIQ
jgi:hypothetical protein